MPHASNKLISYLKRAEGFLSCLQPDPPGQNKTFAIGYGCQLNGKELEFWRDREMTKGQAEAMLRQRVQFVAGAVNRLVKVPLEQHEFDALVSFAYNVGTDEDADTIAEGLGDSTLLRLLNAGDKAAVPEQLRRWHKAGGKDHVLDGRRAEEVAIWLNRPVADYADGENPPT